VLVSIHLEFTSPDEYLIAQRTLGFVPARLADFLPPTPEAERAVREALKESLQNLADVTESDPVVHSAQPEEKTQEPKEEKPKRKRGRPKKAKKDPEPKAETPAPSAADDTLPLALDPRTVIEQYTMTDTDATARLVKKFADAGVKRFSELPEEQQQPFLRGLLDELQGG